MVATEAEGNLQENRIFSQVKIGNTGRKKTKRKGVVVGEGGRGMCVCGCSGGVVFGEGIGGGGVQGSGRRVSQIGE